MQSAYEDIDLGEEPVIVPNCGHLMALSSMDGHMGMSDYYNTEGTLVMSLKPMPETFSLQAFKTCPMCRGPLRDIKRYNRIVRQLLLEQATKKFIIWANSEYKPLVDRLFEEENQFRLDLYEADDLLQQFARTGESSGASLRERLDLHKSTEYQVERLRRYPILKERYKVLFRLRNDVAKFLRKVSEEEQPFGHVFDMIQDVRRREGVQATMHIDRNVFQFRSRMLATSLLIRCDLALMSDFMTLRQSGLKKKAQLSWVLNDLNADFSKNRDMCEQLLSESKDRDQPMLQVEALLFHARWSILERSVTMSAEQPAETIRTSAKDRLELAEEICKKNPGSIRGMIEQVEQVRKMLNDEAFYTVVDSKEKRQVYEAMAREFGGTGHWYTCANGHPFTVGECGGPMQTSTCPQCGAPVGGQSHRPAEGVTRNDEFDREFGRLTI